MKDRLAVGLFLALLYAAIVGLQQHKYPLSQGVESDFVATYLPQSQIIYNKLSGDSAQYRHFDTSSWAYHGPAYPSLIVLFSTFFKKDDPVSGYQFFSGARLVSLLAGSSLLLLIILVCGLRYGVLTAILTGCVPLVFRHTFLVGSDMIACALALWGVYFTGHYRCHQRWIYPLIGGSLLALAISIRHEYLVIFPVGLVYLFVQNGAIRPKAILAFALPLLLLLILDGDSWNSYMTVPIKYLSSVAEIDNFPPELWQNTQLDTLSNITVYQAKLMEQYYGSTIKVLWQAGWQFPYRFLKDFFSALLVLISGGMLAFVGLILFAGGQRHLNYLLAAILGHLLMVSLFGVFSPRYFLFDFILVAILGIYGIQIYVYHHLRKALLILVLLCLPSMLLNVNEIYSENQLTSRLGTYEGYQKLQPLMAQLIGHKPKVLALRGQVAFSADWDWQFFPKNVRNLYTYCLRHQVDLISWDGFGQMLRGEWADKLDDARLARPEFIALTGSRNIGILYFVNRADSVRHLYP